MTRTSRRLKQKPTHTTASPSEERSRYRSSFRPARLALTDRVPLSSAPCASLPSALPLQPLRRRGESTIVGRGPTGLRLSTRKERDGKERGEARFDTQLRGRAREAKRRA